MTVFTLKLSCGQRKIVTAFHIFVSEFFDMVNEDWYEGSGIFTEAFYVVKSLWDFLNCEKVNWKFWKMCPQRGPPALSSQVLERMGRGHSNESLSTPLPQSCYTLIISQNRNELSVQCFRVNHFFSRQCTKSVGIFPLFLGYWGFSRSGQLWGGRINSFTFSVNIRNQEALFRLCTMCIVENQQKSSHLQILCAIKSNFKKPPVYVCVYIYIFKDMKVLILFYKNYKRKYLYKPCVLNSILFYTSCCWCEVKYWFADSIPLYPNEFSLSSPNTPKWSYLM